MTLPYMTLQKGQKGQLYFAVKFLFFFFFKKNK